MQDPFLKHLLIACLIIFGAAAVGKLVELTFIRVLRAPFRLMRMTLDDRVLEVIRRRVTVLAVICGAYPGINEVRKGLSAENVVSLKALDYLESALFLILVFVVAGLLSRIVRSSFEWYIEGVAARTQSEPSPTIAPLATKITNFVLFFVAAMILLDHFGVNIGSLLVSLGVGSLAVALAAQETLANMIAGFVILIDQPFRVGDHIMLPSGDEGDVRLIGLRSTRILNADNNLVVVPNGELVKNRIVNFSYPSRVIRVVVEVTVARGTDIHRVKKILTTLAARFPDVQKEPAPQAIVLDMDGAGIRERLVCYTADYRTKSDIETGLREQIWSAFAKEGIELAIPLQDVRVLTSGATETAKKK